MRLADSIFFDCWFYRFLQFEVADATSLLSFAHCANFFWAQRASGSRVQARDDVSDVMKNNGPRKDAKMQDAEAC